MKIIVLAICFVACSAMLQAQDVGSLDVRFDHFALSVRDVDRSADFYKNVLKLQEITNRAKIVGIRWFSLGDGKELHLISILPGQVTVTKAVHLGLKSPKLNDIITKLNAAKIVYSDWPGAVGTVTKRADGVRQIYFQDPDGYWVEVNDASAQAPTSPQVTGSNDSNVKDHIIALDKAGWEAWKNKDASWIKANATEEFFLVNSDGVSSKADVVKSTGTDCDVKSYSLDNFKFVALDEASVLLTYTAMQDATCNGTKLPAIVRASVVYVKRGDRWLEALYMETPTGK